MDEVGESLASGVTPKIQPGAANEEVGVVLLVETNHRIVIDIGVTGLEQAVDTEGKRPIRGREAESLVIEDAQGVRFVLCAVFR